MRYSYGDVVNNLERYQWCPECGERATSVAKRPQKDSKCKNGHEWYIDLATMAVEPGCDDYGMAYEKIVHPEHYNKHPSGVECIDIIRWFDFNIGVAIKHLWRAGMKPGESAVEDVKKAIWYLQNEVERLSID